MKYKNHNILIILLIYWIKARSISFHGTSSSFLKLRIILVVWGVVLVDVDANTSVETQTQVQRSRHKHTNRDVETQTQMGKCRDVDA